MEPGIDSGVCLGWVCQASQLYHCILFCDFFFKSRLPKNPCRNQTKQFPFPLFQAISKRSQGPCTNKQFSRSYPRNPPPHSLLRAFSARPSPSREVGRTAHHSAEGAEQLGQQSGSQVTLAETVGPPGALLPTLYEVRFEVPDLSPNCFGWEGNPLLK